MKAFLPPVFCLILSACAEPSPPTPRQFVCLTPFGAAPFSTADAGVSLGDGVIKVVKDGRVWIIPASLCLEAVDQ